MVARIRQVIRIVSPVVVGLIGAWLILLVAGRTTYTVGPFRVDFFARPGSGATEIGLPPFGRIEADTHFPPLELEASLREVAATELSSIVNHKGVDGLAVEVEHEGLDALRSYLWRALGLVALGGAVAGAIVYRGRWRRGLTAAVSGIVLFGLGTGISWWTYRPEAFLTPTFTGSLALAPRLVGPLREATGRIEDFRGELERLVGGAVQAYTTIASISPAAQSDVVLLHVSDLHLSPIGMDFAQRLASAFEADLVLDTGDLTSFGTELERGVVDRIEDFDIPYVFVQGNHDSTVTVNEVAAQPNTRVLDFEMEEVAGLRIFGAPHPLFTPDLARDYPDDEIAATVSSVGEVVADRIRELDPPPDILAVHDDRMAVASSGAVPLVVSGHFHQTGARAVDGSLFLRVGSTGAGGLDTFTAVEPIPLEAQILYLDGDPEELVAWDTVSLDPITQDLRLERHLPSEVVETEESAPQGGPTPTPVG